MKPNPFFYLLERAADGLSCICLLFAMVLSMVDVISREVFTFPIPGATELTEIALAALIFFSFPLLAYRHGHIVVDLLDGFTSKRIKRLQSIASGWLGSIVFMAMAWNLHLLASRALEMGDSTTQLKIPYAPILWMMALASILTAISFIYAVTSSRVLASAETHASATDQPVTLDQSC